MIGKFVDFALRNRLLVLAASLMLFAWGGVILDPGFPFWHPAPSGIRPIAFLQSSFTSVQPRRFLLLHDRHCVYRIYPHGRQGGVS